MVLYFAVLIGSDIFKNTKISLTFEKIILFFCSNRPYERFSLKYLGGKDKAKLTRVIILN